MSLQHPDLATYHFGPSLSAPLACLCLRRLRRFTWVGHTTRPWSPTASVLAVAISARAPIATLADEDTLSRGLRTPPLPATHASVGDCWQNSRCRHLLYRKSNTLPATPSCRTLTPKISGPACRAGASILPESAAAGRVRCTRVSPRSGFGVMARYTTNDAAASGHSHGRSW